MNQTPERKLAAKFLTYPIPEAIGEAWEKVNNQSN